MTACICQRGPRTTCPVHGADVTALLVETEQRHRTAGYFDPVDEATALRDETERLRTAIAERDEARAILVRKQPIIDEALRSLNAAGVAPDAPISMRIDRLVAERDAARAEMDALRDRMTANGFVAAIDTAIHETAEAIAAFVDAEAEVRREEGFSYRAVSEPPPTSARARGARRASRCTA